uniref:Cysteine proteinase 3, putative n=1 Tax=Entamoeba invadens TaxID=33085 RepID=S0B0C9_ENTIV|nr:cysteine proteinase 3 precursor, putative [Entamoeba invadens]
MIGFLLIALASALDFQAWTAKYNKRFSAVEALRRRAIFTANSRYVSMFNKEHKFQLSNEGPFAAMTNAEYRAQLKLIRKDDKSVPVYLNRSAPESLDLRTSNKVTPIRDQAQCGSCYTFGSTASLEGRLLMIGGDYQTLDLSEEQLVQCSKEQGNNGCNGGLGKNAYEYIKANGIVQEKDYPYTAVDGSCTVDVSKKYATITGYNSVPRKNDAELKAALVDGVVDVSIDASSAKFQLYKTGVYTDTKCGTGYFDLNHEVAAVGYGTLDGAAYWIVRNSWGTSWGDKGYILMGAEGNTCGVITDPLYPTGVKFL